MAVCMVTKWLCLLSLIEEMKMCLLCLVGGGFLGGECLDWRGVHGWEVVQGRLGVVGGGFGGFVVVVIVILAVIEAM